MQKKGSPACSLEVRTSCNVQMLHLIGPVEMLESSGAQSDNKIECVMGRLDTRLSISFFFNIDQKSKSSHAYFQFIAKSCSGGVLKRRITCVKIPCTHDEVTFLNAFDTMTMSAIMAKKFVALSGSGYSSSLPDSRLNSFSLAFRGTTCNQRVGNLRKETSRTELSFQV